VPYGDEELEVEEQESESSDEQDNIYVVELFFFFLREFMWWNLEVKMKQMRMRGFDYF